MRQIAATVALIVTLSTVSASTSFHELDAIDHQSLVCGCTFYRVDPDAAQNAISGTELVVFDVNSEPPHALINVGNGNISLAPETSIEFPLFSCEPGTQFESSWSDRNTRLTVDLYSTLEGLEACWFSGTATASGHSIAATTSINGACGC
jgi:hypothetical protein